MLDKCLNKLVVMRMETTTCRGKDQIGFKDDIQLSVWDIWVDEKRCTDIQKDK